MSNTGTVSEKTDTRGRLYKDVDGVRAPMPFPPKYFREAMAYKPQEGDHIVVTHPKCGTNWMQFILYLILHDGEPPENGIEFARQSLFIDLMGTDKVETMTRPIILKTHLPYNVCPRSKDAKYFYVARNPKDTSVSYFHQVNLLYKDEALSGFDEFFGDFLRGEKGYGDYFDHFLSWYEHRNDPNVLYMYYEDMKADLKGSVLKVVKFLGEKYFRKISDDPELLEKIIQYSDVEYMKRMKSAAQEFVESSNPDEILNDPNLPIGLKDYLVRSKNNNSIFTVVRKGIVGDWRSLYTPEQNKIMNQKMEERLAGTEALDFWKKIGCV